ncbi:DUF2974 domain-containing protein [Leadbettera azotonutricia]|nr:DUF2974 domain-containing protein [Leadbettera azotonutricia]
MANIFDYLSWRGDLDFSQAPFNPVDNIILTHLSYIPFDNIVPGLEDKKVITIAEAAESFARTIRHNPARFDNIMISKDDPALLSFMGGSKRYRNLGLAAYVNQIDTIQEKQFAALTVLTARKTPFVTYRGTDNTLVGWKEDFNMSFSKEVPAQGEAVRYLEDIAEKYNGPIRIGGHSKGGNLAVYAASFCSKKVQKHICEIYNNDAPGFGPDIIKKDGYQAIKEKIFSFVPETSIIGMLFEHETNYTVVKSVQIGLLQHDVYSWEVAYNDVVRLDEVNKESRFIDRTIKEWLSSLDNKQREGFTEALFTILGSTEASSFPELGTGWLKNTAAMIQSLTSIDETSRDMLFKTIGALLGAAKNNIHTLLPPQKKKKKRAL